MIMFQANMTYRQLRAAQRAVSYMLDSYMLRMDINAVPIGDASILGQLRELKQNLEDLSVGRPSPFGHTYVQRQQTLPASVTPIHRSKQS